MNTLSLDELIEEGGPRFHIMRAHHTGNTKHSHSFYELVYVTEGYCIHTHGGLSSLLTEGAVFLLPPGTAHSYSGNRMTHIFNCLFEASFLGDALGSLSQLPPLQALISGEGGSVAEIRLPMGERKSFLRTLDEMYDAYSAKQPGYEIWLRGRLLCLLTEYARAAAQPQTGNGYSANVRDALGIIDLRYADSTLTVKEIADALGVSADHLTRQFHAVTGVTAREYLRRYRFARAMELLAGGMPVGEVAKAAGFSRIGYFSREFTKELGVTPTEYKKQ